MNLFDLNPQEDDDWQLDIGHEAIDYPEGNNYIVPLFEKTQIKTQKGCGIFVGNYLITVGHVAIDSDRNPLPELYAYFNDDYIRIGNESIIYDGRGKIDVDGVHDDLIVYYVPGINSPFCLNEQDIRVGLSLYTMPYDYIEETNKVQRHGNECRITSVLGKELNGENIWTNCFMVNNPCIFCSGNSGSALFRKNVVYGILIGGDGIGNNGRKYCVLDARYIKAKLEELALLHQ